MTIIEDTKFFLGLIAGRAPSLVLYKRKNGEFVTALDAYQMAEKLDHVSGEAIQELLDSGVLPPSIVRKIKEELNGSKN